MVHWRQRELKIWEMHCILIYRTGIISSICAIRRCAWHVNMLRSGVHEKLISNFIAEDYAAIQRCIFRFADFTTMIKRAGTCGKSEAGSKRDYGSQHSERPQLFTSLPLHRLKASIYSRSHRHYILHEYNLIFLLYCLQRTYTYLYYALR